VWERWAVAIRLGDLSRERNDLDGALETLRAAMTAAEQAGVAVYLPDGYIALARTLAAQQDFVAAAAALDRATYVAHRLASPAYIRQIRAYRARLALASGNLAAAEQWQSEVAPDVDGRICSTYEIEALTVARVLIAQGRSGPSRRTLDAAHTLLEQLRHDAVAHGRTNSVIEIEGVAALAAAAAGQHERALQHVRQALELAEDEGYARIFLDEGAPMAELLQSLALRQAHEPRDAHSDTISVYADRLLSAFPVEQLGAVANRSRMWPVPRSALERADALVEVLSERELEVLRLIADGASNQAIAAALVISLGTVKSHINHILGKLAASNRTEAAARARDLGLLTSEHRH
jgi:LuxR family maltose regulon positive regulatory protein